MQVLIQEWAGVDRQFRLMFGDILALEEASGKVGIGAIYLQICSGSYTASQVFHTLRLALIGGGMSPLDAKALVADRWEVFPLGHHAEVAAEIHIALTTGIAPAKGDAPRDDDGDVSNPYALPDFLGLMETLGMSPNDLRETSYADIVNLCRAAAEGRESGPKAPSEDDFLTMIQQAKEAGIIE